MNYVNMVWNDLIPITQKELIKESIFMLRKMIKKNSIQNKRPAFL